MRPTLAGRSRHKVEKLAAELGCPSAVYSLQDHTAMVSSLQGMAAVLHCAGPFSQTARPMMQACLASHVHYLDITGEIDVFELAHSVDDKAKRSGMVLCPGVGFDVVPTDCLALKLKLAMPDATHLALGFDSRTGLSKGTAKTAIESAGQGSRVRENGKLVEVPLGARTRKIDFGNGERLAVGIPWGDVSTAFYTTGIPNIEVFSASSERAVQKLHRVQAWRPILRRRWVRKLMQFGVEHRVKPPDQAQREMHSTYLWGEVRNRAGHTLAARQRTANGYSLTVSSSLGILSVLLGAEGASGFLTPSMVVGPDYVAGLQGSSEIQLEPTARAA
jgi:short subunit dehydrogenase-like uncharacterized protein